MAARTPPKLSPSYVENAALHYLERFASSTANLRRVLMRKADRSLAYWGGERAQAAEWVEAAIAKLARLGYVDDAAYAGQKAASLHRRGRAVQAIRAALAAKGVGADLAAAAIETLAADEGNPDFTAAVTLARRRRLGPFRPPELRAETRARDLATLARAGFDFDTARRVVDADGPEALEDAATR